MSAAQVRMTWLGAKHDAWDETMYPEAHHHPEQHLAVLPLRGTTKTQQQ